MASHGGRGRTRSYSNRDYNTNNMIYIELQVLNATPDSRYSAMLMMGRDAMRQQMQIGKWGL